MNASCAVVTTSTSAAPSLDPGRLTSRMSRPWAPWVRSLLGHLIRFYCPTLDRIKVVRGFEMLCRKQDCSYFPGGETEPRFWGHICAFLDNAIADARLTPEHRAAVDSMLKRPLFNLERTDRGKLVKTDGPLLSDYLTSLRQGLHLPPKERGDFLVAFGDAYSKTITPEGQSWGDPAGTGLLYLRIAILALTWTFVPAPRTLADFHRQLWRLGHRDIGKLSELEKLRLEDERVRDEKNFRQLCKRMGLKLISRRVTRSKSKGLR